MADMQSHRFRRVLAVHPQWQGDLLLSSVDDTLVHEAHGSRGTYRHNSGTLHIAWKDYPAEDFVEIDGIYVHQSLVPNFAQASLDAKTQADTARPYGELPPIQVVSLQATPHRRERFADLNRGFQFEFFDAVDGRQIDRSRFFGSRLAEADVPYSPGAVGCALSHLTLWERSVRDHVILTVVEDDAVLRRDFEAKSQELIARLPPDWDIIMWGWNFDSILSVLVMPGISTTVISCNQDSLRQAIGRFQTELFEPHIFRLDKCFGTCAYTISPAGSRKFRQGCFPLRQENVYFPLLNRLLPNDGIDIAMNRIYSMTNSYVSFPPLAVTPNDNSESLTLAR
jgi:glycosyl transferase, family 25